MQRFILAIGIAVVVTFGVLAAFHSGGEYNLKKPATEKQILVKIHEDE